MKQKLLTLCATMLVLASAAAQNVWLQKESTVLNPLTGQNEVVTREYTGAPVATATNAENLDSVTLTFKWVLATGAEPDKELAFQAVNKDLGTSYAVAQATLLKATDRTMSMRVPKGNYALAFKFDTKTEATLDLSKIDGRDDIALNSDTTIVFNGNNCTKKICFRFLLPNGKEPKLGWQTSNIDYSAANVFRYNISNTVYYKTPEGKIYFISGTTYFCDYNSASTGNNRENSADIYVNPDISPAYFSAAYVPIIPLNVAKNSRTDTDPIYIALMGTSLGVPDTTFVLNHTKYIDVTPPAVKHSLFQPSDAIPAPEYVNEVLFSSNVNALGVRTAHNTPGCALSANIQPDVDLKIMYKPSILETKSVIGFTVASGFGIELPRQYIKDDGSIQYTMSDCTGAGMYDLILDYPTDGHPFFAYNSKEQEPEFGNSAPILSLVLRSSPTGLGYDYPFTMLLNPLWIGNFGETRDIDRHVMTFSAIADCDTVFNDLTKFSSGIAAWSKAEANKGKRMNMVFHNTNFTVDTINGCSHVELSYTNGGTEICVPSLQMLQLRNQQGKITSKFEDLSDVQINFAGSDINWNPAGRYDYASPSEVKFEVAPWESEEWKQIQITEIPDYYHLPVYGNFYRASVADSQLTSPSGWFKVRISLKDAVGNTSVQNVGPAFYVKNATGAVLGIDADNAFKLLFNEGSLYLSNGNEATFDIYATDGTHILTEKASRCDVSSLSKGLYIAKAKAEGKTVTVKFVVR